MQESKYGVMENKFWLKECTFGVELIKLRLSDWQPQFVFWFYFFCFTKASFEICLYWGLEAPNTDLIYTLASDAMSTKPVSGLS